MAAAIVRHGAFKFRIIAEKHAIGCCYATKAEKKKGLDRRPIPKIKYTAQSMASKGFLRPQKDYTPPEDVDLKLTEVVKASFGEVNSIAKFESPSKKFEFLNACFNIFQHGVPNSLLHTIETIEDVRNFYLTPICTKTPLDKLKMMDLPPNLSVQYGYVRFHPDTDTKFGGKTAFPESSTLVTGLKYKEKYPGHIQKPAWPYDTE